MTKTPKRYLFDIVFFGEKIQEYLREIHSLDDFIKDEKGRLAIERCIEIMCEASQKLRKNHHISLSLADKAYNFRGSLSHQYDEIGSFKIFRFATSYVPQMVEEAKELLQDT